MNTKKIIVGLTGGIGSGKTTVARFFEEKGIPIYNSDSRARELMNTNKEIRTKLIKLFGAQAYIGEDLNRSYIASATFHNKEMLEKLNAIVHPVVFIDFDNWYKQQKSEIVMKEAAILIESGSYKDCDYIVSVIADEEIRLERTQKRDNLSEQQIRDRMKNQISDSQRIEKSHFIIKNEGEIDELKKEVDIVYHKLKAQF